MKPRSEQSGSERGAVLVVSLFLLVVLTLLGVTSMQGTTMETRIAVNREDRATAFMAAEAALRDAEQAVQVQTSTPNPVDATCVANCDVWAPGALFGDYDDYLDPAIWADGRIPASAAPLVGVAAAPTYAIEFVRFVPDTLNIGGGGQVSGRYFYQVTARGEGETATAHAVLQSALSKRF